MKTILRISVTALVLVTLFSACTDHLSRPLSPQRLRLKTIIEDGIIKQMFSTTFEYDAQNRQTGYTHVTYYPGAEQTSHASITYDAQGQYQRIDQEIRNGTGALVANTTSLFTYRPDGQGGKFMTVNLYDRAQSTVSPDFTQQITYQFDANNRLVRSDFIQYSGATPLTYLYTYTGDNITQSELIDPNIITTNTFDDKPNPLYGLISQSIGLDMSNQFSRNNILERKTNEGGGGTNGAEYNAQGLLSKLNLNNFFYESY